MNGKSPEARLRQNLNFTDDDLDANRHGYMSKRQRFIVHNDRMFWKRSSIAIGVLSLPLGVFLLLEGTPFEVVVLVGGAAALLFVYLNSNRMSFERDLEKNDVLMISGEMHKRKIYNPIVSKHPNYVLQIGTLELNVMVEPYLAFNDGEDYIVYYLSNTNTILSAEVLK